MSKIKFQVLKAGFDPILATEGSAGFDLKADLTEICKGDELSTLNIHRNTLIPTGVKAAIPVGYVGLLFPRSGKGHKEGMRLGNTVGVIDSDYRGEIFVSFNADGRGAKFMNCTVKHGERFAQMVVVPALTIHEYVDSLDDTDRGESGFGDSGEA